jgi:hypothetical protein
VTFIPSRLLEAANGVILVLLAYFLLFLVIHLVRQWICIHRTRQGVHCWLRSLPVLYAECKPEIAMLVFITGLEVKTAVLWAARHSFNHRFDMHVLHESATTLLISSTLMIIFGVVCWNRETVPFRGSFRWWIFMVLTSLAFGVGMAVI